MGGQPKRVLIEGGALVIGPSVTQQDLLIEGERIAALGRLNGTPADEKVDAGGLLVLPGAVDPHVHFNDAFMGVASSHDYESGTRAAAFGGVTSVIDFSAQGPNERLSATLARKHEEARGRALVDWGVHPVITRRNDETVSEIFALVAAGAPTVKCYLTYRKQGLMVEPSDLKFILRALRAAGGMLLVHAEDNAALEANIAASLASGKTSAIHHALSRPPEVETTAIRHCLQAARETGGRLYIVHLAAMEGLDLLASARVEGLDVLGETCTHYLVLNEELLRRDDGIKWICSPPLRTAELRSRLWAALRTGALSVVSSDDAAYSWEAKRRGEVRFDLCPSGLPGVEARFHLLYSEGVAKGRLSLNRMVDIVSTAPARLFGLSPQKGSLLPGADADIVLFDPNAEWVMGGDTLHMASDWSAYENIKIKGRIKQVYSRGELIIDGDRCLGEKGRGRFLKRRLPELI